MIDFETYAAAVSAKSLNDADDFLDSLDEAKASASTATDVANYIQKAFGVQNILEGKEFTSNRGEYDEPAETIFENENYSYVNNYEEQGSSLFALSEPIQLTKGTYNLICDDKVGKASGGISFIIYNPYYGCYGYEEDEYIGISTTNINGQNICTINIDMDYREIWIVIKLTKGIQKWYNLNPTLIKVVDLPALDQVAQNTTNISTLQSSVSAVRADVDNNANAIETAQSDIANAVEDIDEVKSSIADITTDLSDIISKTGKVYTLTPTVGYSIISNVNTGSFTFSKNENRMYCQFRSDNDFTVSRISTRVALITVNSEGRCVASTGWTTADISVEANADYTYYLLCDFTDESLIPTVAVSSSIDEKIDDIQGKITAANTEIIALRQRNIAADYGYNDVITLSWEMGSINTGNGSNTNSGANVIRMPKPIKLESDVQIIITSSEFRIRPYMYSSDGTSYVEAGAWYKGEINKLLTIDTDCTYRFQIATVDGSDIDVDKAMLSVAVVYADDSKHGTLPGYWTDHLEEKVKTINSLLTDGKDKTAFLFLTDTHWNESKTALNGYGINTLAMQYIRDRCNIDYLVHGGDLNSEYRSNRDIARQMMTKPMAMMRSVFPHVFVTRGNHDDNIEGSGNVWSYVITQSDSYSYMFRNTPDAHFGKTGTYFYHDVEFEKVRYICLDSTDMVYSNSVDESKCDQKILAYGYDQLQWLCDTLKNTPDGYSIIIYNHAMLAPSIVTVEHGSSSPQTRAKNYLVLCNLLKAFKNRQNYTFDTTGYFPTVHNDYYEGVLSADFTNCNADIVAVFSGHEHVDCIEEILDSSGNGIGIYNTCTQNSSNMFSSSVLSSSYQSNMEIGTTTELVWDIVIVDRANKHVDMVRIGAGAQSVRSFDF